MKTIRLPFPGVVAVAVVAVAGCLALSAGTKQAFITLYATTIGILLISAVTAHVARGHARAFWFGFATVGWGLFLLGFGVWLEIPIEGQETYNTLVNEGLLTTGWLQSLHNTLIAGDDLARIGNYGYDLAIGHLLLTLGLALAGGGVGSAMRRAAVRGAGKPSTRMVWALSGGAGVAALLGIAVLSPRGHAPYFPATVVEDGKNVPGLRARRYGKHLEAMGEPSLWRLSQDDRSTEVYRLLWLPTFHHPVCVRVARSGATIALKVTVLDGAGGYDPGTVAFRRTLTITSGQWNELLQHLEATHFWSMPLHDPKPPGEDGDQLIVEGIKNGRYQAVDRQSPDAHYRALCETLLKLSRIKYQKQWDDYH